MLPSSPASPTDLAVAASLLEQVESFLAGTATAQSASAALAAEPAHETLAAIRRTLFDTLHEPRDRWESMRPQIALDAELLAQFEWHSARAAHCRTAVWNRIRKFPFLDRNEIAAEVRRCLEDCPPYQAEGFHSQRRA